MTLLMNHDAACKVVVTKVSSLKLMRVLRHCRWWRFKSRSAYTGRQHEPMKYWYPVTKLHGVTIQNTWNWIFTLVNIRRNNSV